MGKWEDQLGKGFSLALGSHLDWESVGKLEDPWGKGSSSELGSHLD